MKNSVTLILILAMLSLFGQEPFRENLCLNGLWEANYSMDASFPEEDAVWEPERVPSTWHTSHHAMKYGFFRTSIDIPESWRGKKLELFFELINDFCEIRFNGETIYSCETSSICQSVPIPDDCIRYGQKNDIIIKTGHGPLNNRNTFRIGIARDAWLFAKPSISISHVLIDTSVRTKTIAARVAVSGLPADATGFSLHSRIFDENGTVLELPEAILEGIQNESITLKTVWEDPVLWGFGDYGTNKLYTMCTELLKNGIPIDTKYDRFGFREFYAEKDKLYLNGKPIFLKGDLTSGYFEYMESPAAASAYYSMIRSDNINAFRFHSSIEMEADSWLTAADECGFIVQPEMRGNHPKDGTILADTDQTKRWLSNYLTYHYNHPSVVSWCINNESFSCGLASPENLRKISQPLMQSFDRLMTWMRDIDPGRIIEIHHNYSLFPFMKMGKFSRRNFEVFNIHPYGNLQETVNAEEKATGFDGSVPVIVGEIFANPKRFLFIKDPEGAYAEQLRTANSYKRQILQAASANHVSGVVLCSGSSDGHYGFNSEHDLRIGPWYDLIQKTDDNGSIYLDEKRIVPIYPSLSGPGMKVHFMRAWCHASDGHHVNWFDAARPIHVPSVVDEYITQAMHDIDGQDVAPLYSERRPEIVFLTGMPGALVHLIDSHRPGEVQSVISDPAGTAWFRLTYPGKYRIECNGKTRIITISGYPSRTTQAGYDYITFSGFDETDPVAYSESLKRSPDVLPMGIIRQEDIIQGGEFDFFETPEKPNYWGYITHDMGHQSADAYQGDYSLELVGNDTKVGTKVVFEAGQTYRLSAAMKKIKGNENGIGLIQIIDKDWKLKKQFESPATFGEWQIVSADYTADGTELFFYLQNANMGQDGRMLYDSASVKRLPGNASETQEPAALPVPSQADLDADGFIRDFMVLGPFPNCISLAGDYEAATKELIPGEATCFIPMNQTIIADFPKGNYWKPGMHDIKIS